MDKTFIACGALAGLVLAGTAVGSVSAQSVAEATGISEAQAIEIALLEVAGDVQEVELETEDGAMVFEVEILNAEGQEFEIEIAADTGDVLEVEAEDPGDEGDEGNRSHEDDQDDARDYDSDDHDKDDA